jgi:hypothetical protein
MAATACGGLGQPCCGAGLAVYCSASFTTCNRQSIADRRCIACGQRGQACCDGGFCAAGTCGRDLLCH